MMKTILVPVGGGEADATVLQSAFAVAEPLGAHLELMHVRVAVGDAAVHTPHMEFARGVGLASALEALGRGAARRAECAERNVHDFCSRHGIEMVDAPRPAPAVTARWRRDEGEPIERLLFHARHHDLVVMSRPAQLDGLPPDRLETLLLGCGRPLLIVPPRAPLRALGTAMVCWKETRDAAHAVSAAMPLLAKAQRVAVVSVNEEDGGQALTEAVRDVVRELAWNGISAEAHLLARGTRSTADSLFAAAGTHRVDLMVMGAYGHRYLREALFGGCTQSAIDAAHCPVFLVH
jgi:nucleotide-binding universal stress UspA family protein